MSNLLASKQPASEADRCCKLDGWLWRLGLNCDDAYKTGWSHGRSYLWRQLLSHSLLPSNNSFVCLSHSMFPFSLYVSLCVIHSDATRTELWWCLAITSVAHSIYVSRASHAHLKCSIHTIHRYYYYYYYYYISTTIYYSSRSTHATRFPLILLNTVPPRPSPRPSQAGEGTTIKEEKWRIKYIPRAVIGVIIKLQWTAD